MCADICFRELSAVLFDLNQHATAFGRISSERKKFKWQVPEKIIRRNSCLQD